MGQSHLNQIQACTKYSRLNQGLILSQLHFVDNIVRMPFKGKEGRTYSTHQTDPDVRMGHVIDTSMTHHEPEQSIFNCNDDIVHSDDVLWHDPQQPVQYFA
jgi:hypothetical protein